MTSTTLVNEEGSGSAKELGSRVPIDIGQSPSNPSNGRSKLKSKIEVCNGFFLRIKAFLRQHWIVVCMYVIVFGSLGVLVHIHRLHTDPQSSFYDPSALGRIQGPAPPPEHLQPELYRTSWTQPTPETINQPLDYDILEPLDPIEGKGRGWTIIFIHGLGSRNSSHGYAWRDALLSTIEKPPYSVPIGNLTGLRFIFPKAPIRPITVYSDQPKGGERPGWFDIKDWRDLNYLEDEEGLRKSTIQISSIIMDQVKRSKIQMNQTIIAGFSQGSVMSLLLTLTLHEAPAATLILSGYLPLPFRLPLLLSPVLNFYRRTSLYWIHGTDDNVLNYNAAKAGFGLFQSLSHGAFCRAKFKTLAGLEHGFSSDEEIVVTNWIEGIVDRGSEGAYDNALDNLIQPETKLDDIQSSSRVVAGRRTRFSKGRIKDSGS